jgi:soluble lytic murein transglycosylase
MGKLYVRGLLIASAIGAMAAGGIVALVYRAGDSSLSPIDQLTRWQEPGPGEYSIDTLRSLSPRELNQLAKQSNLSLDRSRARYLLAQEALETDPAKALNWLENLDQEYPVLAPHILSLQAQAWERLDNGEKAEATWQTLIEDHPDSPISAEAFYALGQDDPSYQDRLLAQWPAHPLAMELTLKRLEQNPNDLDLLLRVARHGLYTYKIHEVLERLEEDHARQLAAEDWQAIAFAHWEKLNYEGAAKAYAKAPPTAQNLYRAARSFQISDRVAKAQSYYQQLLQAFPNAPDTALGLKRLAQLTENRDYKQALKYWDTLYRTFPHAAGEALLEKADVLDQLGSQASARQARQSVLNQHSDSDAAGEFRWERAQALAQGGDRAQAAKLAQSIPLLNPHSEIAPKAGFWAGRWWQEEGEVTQARQSFETVLRQHPESYYAWRSAVFLNLPVGNFNTVWQRQPQVKAVDYRAVPPAGSELLQELYQLGQDGTAWRLWQVEFTNAMEPTVAEQFTDGLIRNSVGDYLDGMFMLNSLAWRDLPEDRAEYQQLRQQPGFWTTLYPFAFGDTVQDWSGQRRLNPLLVTALMRQESRFMPGIVSSAGATGLMQVMPSTGEWVASQVGLTDYQLNDPDDSVNLGTWYLNYTHQEWDGNSMLAVASYNAGPGNVADWLQRFNLSDPDRFVEQIPFPETQGYVEAVFENYWNYLRLYNPEVSQLVAQYSPAHLPIVTHPLPHPMSPSLAHQSTTTETDS